MESKARVTLERIDSKVRDLNRMRNGLAEYLHACQHRSGLDTCPLLDALGEGDELAT